MSDWKVGDRVLLPKVQWPMRQPYPEHVGKTGTITGTKKVGEGFSSPVITLDDGTVLRGYECWWEPVAGAKEA